MLVFAMQSITLYWPLSAREIGFDLKTLTGPNCNSLLPNSSVGRRSVLLPIPYSLLPTPYSLGGRWSVVHRWSVGRSVGRSSVGRSVASVGRSVLGRRSSVGRSSVGRSVGGPQPSLLHI